MVNPQADGRRIGQRVQLVFMLVSLALVPMYEQARSIIGTLQQLNGLYSMPVLAAFIVAIFVRGANARALRWAMLFGVALYTVFTFVWTPLHYLHLMFITLLATIAFAVVGSRVMARPVVVAASEVG